MSVIFRIAKVTPEMVEVLCLAEELFESYPKHAASHNYSCLKIRSAARAMGFQEFLMDDLLEDYEEYTKERVYSYRWAAHQSSSSFANFDNFFTDQWDVLGDRNIARLTALRQFKNNLKHRLENQQ